MATLVSKALLSTCFDSDAKEIVLLKILGRLKSVYKGVLKLDSTVNSMHKDLLLISGHKCQLIIEELFDVYLEMAGVEAATAHDEYSFPVTPEVLNRRQSSHSSKKRAVFVQLVLIRKQNEELTNEIQYMRTSFSKELSYLRTILNILPMFQLELLG